MGRRVGEGGVGGSDKRVFGFIIPWLVATDSQDLGFVVDD